MNTLISDKNDSQEDDPADLEENNEGESKDEQNMDNQAEEAVESKKKHTQYRDEKSSPAKSSKTPLSTYEEKQRQLLLADCQRLKKRMTKVKTSIQRPPM